MNAKTQNRKKVHEQGFTLVELMVSLVIFSTVMVISTGTLLIMIDINAKAQAVYSSTTNLAFALDNMTRELRTGYHYYCNVNPTSEALQLGTRDCTNGDYVAFTREKDDLRVGYRLVQDLETNPPYGRIEQREEGSNNWIPLTSEDVVVETLEITVTNSTSYYSSPESSRDTAQPLIDMFISGYVNNGLDQDTDFSVQSRIVQRRLDII